ncbi:hypothetical protein PAA8504_03701 [Palleronia abyssalis]|uniref:Uncharacterized protein n=1 Tax=Palleronia abyssalis TaxID=1501240 RepID=A0A2R8C0E3_9RHOB|nr:hypothetical protein PAA8504_03701 [Palleronia abyssalis]
MRRQVRAKAIPSRRAKRALHNCGPLRLLLQSLTPPQSPSRTPSSTAFKFGPTCMLPIWRWRWHMGLVCWLLSRGNPLQQRCTGRSDQTVYSVYPTSERRGGYRRPSVRSGVKVSGSAISFADYLHHQVRIGTGSPKGVVPSRGVDFIVCHEQIDPSKFHRTTTLDTVGEVSRPSTVTAQFTLCSSSQSLTSSQMSAWVQLL